MSARTLLWTTVSAAAAIMLAGCGAMPPPAARTGDAQAHVAAAPSATGELLDDYLHAMDMVDQARFAEALGELTEIEPLLAGVGDRPRAAAALFWRGFCEEKLTRPNQAAARYRAVLSVYSDTKAADLARHRLAALEADKPSQTP